MRDGYFDQDAAEAKRLLLVLRLHAKQRGYADSLWGAARMVGISRGTAENLLRQRRKSIPSRVLAAIRREYIRICMNQIAHLQAQVDDLQGKCGDDAFENLGAAVARLVDQLREARQRNTD